MGKSELNPIRAGVSLGLLFGIIHAIWVVLIATWPGMMAATYGMHFISRESAMPFAASMAVAGIVAAAICGAIVGWLFAVIWNWTARFK